MPCSTFAHTSPTSAAPSPPATYSSRKATATALVGEIRSTAGSRTVAPTMWGTLSPPRSAVPRSQIRSVSRRESGLSLGLGMKAMFCPPASRIR